MTRVLDESFLQQTRSRIDAAILPLMEDLYGHFSVHIPAGYRPGLKTIEQIVSFYDYHACGISVIAPMAASGHKQAARLVAQLVKNMEHYRSRIHDHEVKGVGRWTVPLRRLLFHAALAYPYLKDSLSARDRQRFRALVEQQVHAAIEHNADFFPGVKNLHLGFANNHTAIFMQGVFYCGKVFQRPQWMKLAKEFAQRFYDSGHPDGYWEEHTNIAREGGPSMLYTPLTAGSLFDVLDGKRKAQPKFIRAGAMFRGFLNEDHRPIAIADERSNLHDRWFSYGLALHSLTAQGRSFIVDTLTQADFSDHSPETLAVIRHELSLMRTGPCARPENQSPGHTRLSLPLGVVRANRWTAGASALRALNLVRSANNDYAIDQQNMAYLAHRDAGVILTGVKSKRDVNYSTLRILGEGYTDRTGRLAMGKNWAQALLHYPTFDATLRWDLGRRARLTLATDDPREIITTLPITDPRFVKAPKKFETLELKGYSPYTAGNASKPIQAVRFKWRKKLVIEFGI